MQKQICSHLCNGVLVAFNTGKCFTPMLVLIHALTTVQNRLLSSPLALTSGSYRMSILGNDTTYLPSLEQNSPIVIYDLKKTKLETTFQLFQKFLKPND